MPNPYNIGDIILFDTSNEYKEYTIAAVDADTELQEIFYYLVDEKDPSKNVHVEPDGRFAGLYYAQMVHHSSSKLIAVRPRA